MGFLTEYFQEKPVWFNSSHFKRNKELMQNTDLTYEELLKENEKLKQQLQNCDKTSDNEQSKLNAQLNEYIEELKQTFETVNAQKEELEQKRSLFQLIEDSISDVIWMIDLQGNIIYLSASASRVFGYSKEELLSLKIKDLLPEESFESYSQVVEKRIKDEKNGIKTGNNSVDLIHKRKNGELFWAEVSSNPLRDANNKLTGIIGISRDVTKRVAAEREIRKLSVAIEQNQASIVITDTKGTIQYVNSTFCDVTGYSFEEAIGNNPRILKSGKVPKKVYDEMWETIAKGEVWRGELINKRKNGEHYWERVIISPIKDGNNQIVNFVATKENVTERKKAEKELKDSNAAKDKFFSIISHDLRSPIGSIQGLTEALLDDFDSYGLDELRTFISTIHKTVSSTFNMVDNLLVWARNHQNRIDFEPKKIVLNQLLKNAVQLELIEAEKKEITVEINAKDKISIFADYNMLSTVLRNLLFNAIKFTNRGGKVEIKSFILDKNKVQVCMIDNGVGIPTEKLPKLFKLEEASSTKGTENEKGTGLGLVLCKEFVERNGGEIWVESKVGKGSSFCFTIPLVQDTSD